MGINSFSLALAQRQNPLPPQRLLRWAQYLVVLLLVLALASSRLSAAEPNRLLEQYFDALRTRGLYSVAEEYALARQSEEGLSQEDRLLLSVELARTLVDHGVLLEGQSRNELWKTAEETLNRQLSATDSPLERLTISFWQCRLAARQAGTLAFEAKLQPQNSPARPQAIAAAKAASRQLDSIAKRLEETIQTKKRGAGYTSEALNDWLNQVHLQQVQLLLKRAEITPPGSERTGLLIEASQRLDDLRRHRDTAPLSLEMNLLRACTARLRGDDRLAEQILKSAVEPDSNLLDRDRVLAEQVRLELSRERVDDALQIVTNRLRLPSPPSDEFRAEAVRVLLDAARVAAKGNDQQLQQQLLEEAASLNEQTYGSWRKLTATLLQQYQQERNLGSELATLVREAQAAWQAHQVDQAVDKFGAAAGLAFRTGRAEESFQYAYTRASILLQEQRWEEAANALDELVRQFPRNSQAASADLLRCYALGRSQPHSEIYVDALQQHLIQFPDSPTTGDALWMLGVESENSQVPETATRYYRQIPNSHEKYPAAELRIVLLDEALLRQAELPPDQRQVLEAQARDDVRRIMDRFLAPPHQLNLQESQLLLRCAQLLLNFKIPQATEADRILLALERSLNQQNFVGQLPQAHEQLKALQLKTAQLRILSLALQNRQDEAKKLIEQNRDADLNDLLEILSSLTSLTTRISEEHAADLGELQRSAVREIATRRNELTPEQKFLLEQAEAQASLALKDWIGVIHSTEHLLESHPNDLQLLRQLANAFRQQGTPDDLQQARKLWLKIESLEPKGTPGWLEARVEIADLLAQSGDRQAARKLLGVTRTLYPKMGTAELKLKADRIWSDLQSSP